MYLEINTNNQVMGYSDNETSNSVKTDNVVPSFTATQILKFVDGNFVVEDSQSLIDAKVLFDAQEYARKRQAEYPSIAELTVALYDTDDKSAIETKRAEVKAKYPKPE
jgi:hypothetical protein